MLVVKAVVKSSHLHCQTGRHVAHIELTTLMGILIVIAQSD